MKQHTRLFASAVLLLSTLHCAVANAGYKLYEVTPNSREQCDMLYELSQHDAQAYDFLLLSKLPHQPAHVMLPATHENEFLLFSARHQLQPRLLVEDMHQAQMHAFVQDRLLREPAANYSRTPTLGTNSYHSHAEINEYLAYLAQRYPTRVKLQNVGRSYEQRLMQTVTISNGLASDNKNIILVDGGIHAREWISPAAVLYLIEQLVEHAEENADLLERYDWVILPVANPDGYEYSRLSGNTRMWRKTRQPYKQQYGQDCTGADPNRNFGFHWNENGASSNPCSEIFAGPKAFSEPEAQVVRDLILKYVPRGKMYLTLHSYGSYLLYPWGWSNELPDTVADLDEVASAGRDAIRAATGRVYTVGSSTNVLYEAAGASDDYAFAAGFPISLTMELPAGGLMGFNPPTSSIDSLVKETWIGIRAIARKVVQKY